jgi:hypothetical protein
MASGTIDFERLLVSFEANLKKYQGQVEKAAGLSDKAASKIEKRFQKMEGNLARIGRNFSGSLLDGLNPAVLASAAGGAIAAMARNAVKDLADIKDNADRAGLSIQEFQKLTFVARQGGGGAEDIVDLFQKLNKSLSEAKSKGNDLGKILEANNVPLVDANGNLRKNTDLFENIVDLINNAANEQDATAISMAAFGKSAADALPFLKQSSAEIRRQKELAATIGDDIVKAAADFDDAWTAAWDNWTTKGKAAAGAVLKAIKDAREDPAANKQVFIPGRGRVFVPKTDADKLADIGAQINDLARQRKAAQDQLANAGNSFFPNLSAPVLEDRIADLTRRIGELSQAFLPALSGNPFDAANLKNPAIIPNLGGGKKLGAGTKSSFPDGIIGNYVDQVVTAESGGKAFAKNPRSSATGVGQFIESTWLRLFKENFPDRAQGMSRSAILALRKDADISRSMIEAYAKQNADVVALCRRGGDRANLTSCPFPGATSRGQSRPG